MSETQGLRSSRAARFIRFIHGPPHEGTLTPGLGRQPQHLHRIYQIPWRDGPACKRYSLTAKLLLHPDLDPAHGGNGGWKRQQFPQLAALSRTARRTPRTPSAVLGPSFPHFGSLKDDASPAETPVTAQRDRAALGTDPVRL